MKDVDDLLKNIERGLKNKANIDKYIRRLRQQNQLDSFFRYENKKVTLLMYYVFEGNYEKIRELVRGENAASRLIVSEYGGSTLLYACNMAARNPDYDQRIIDLLLEQQAEEQISLVNQDGITPLFICIRENNLGLLRKIAPVSGKAAFLTRAKISWMNSDRSIEDYQAAPIHLATANNQLPLINELLKYYPEEQALCEDSFKRLPIFEAAAKGYIGAFQQFLPFNFRGQLQVRNDEGLNLLELAIQGGNHEIIETILSNGEDSLLLIENPKGFIPIDNTCTIERPNLLKLLLRYHQDAQLSHVSSKDSHTVITYACHYARINALRAIIEITVPSKMSAYLLTQQKSGVAPLQIALRNAQNIPNYPDEIIDILLSHARNEQLALVTEDGDTVLALALYNSNPLILKKINEYTEQKLLLVPNKKGIIPFHYAVLTKQLNFAKILLEHNPSEQINTFAENFLPIHLACTLDYLPMIDLILQHEPSQANARTKDGVIAPLHLAIHCEHKLATRCLLKKGADRLVFDGNMKRPIHHALFKRNLFLVKELLTEFAAEQILAKNFGNMNVFHIIAITGHYDAAVFICTTYPEEARQALKEMIHFGLTPLHLACFSKDEKMIKLFLQYGAPVDAHGGVNGIGTALHAACFQDYPGIIAELLHYKSNPYIEDNEGLLPFHRLCVHASPRTIRQFIQPLHGLEARDVSGRTGIVFAVMFERHAMAEELIKLGFDVNTSLTIEDKTITLLKMAIENIDFKMFELLLRNGANPNTVLKAGGKEYNYVDLIKENEDEDVKSLFLAKLNEYVKQEISRAICSTPQDHAISSYSYLRLMGFSKETIEEFQDARQSRQEELKANRIQFFKPVGVPSKTYTWLKGLISSVHEKVFPVEVGEGHDAFCYIDAELMKEQGCCDEDLEELSKMRLGAKRIKKLSDDRGSISDLIQFPGKAEEAKYTHELKITKIGRILLFPMASDSPGACLYVGARYASMGLHQTSHIHAIKQSASSGKAIQMHWPNQDQDPVTKGVILRK